ncbi:MAG: hypothetical protein JSW07_13990 [bacterium]|nr:MAG: hypothetical protein JSW07_13990 [bacterium]
MDNFKSSLIKNLSVVDTKIQKILWIQLIVIIVYGLLLFDGLKTKRQIDVLTRQLDETINLRSRFAWLDSLSFVLVKHSYLLQQYQTYLEGFNNKLERLQGVDRVSDYYNVVVESYRVIDPIWRDVQSWNVIAHVKKLAQQGSRLIDQQFDLVEQLNQPQPLDSVHQAVNIRQSLKPLPTIIDTLKLLINKIYPSAIVSYDTLHGLIDFLNRHNHPQQLPSLDSVKTAVNDFKLFARTYELSPDSLVVLKKRQVIIADSIRIKDQQKGKINLSFIEQEVSVKFAFKFGLPLLVFFNHLLFLLLRKKASLHKAFVSVKSKKDKKIPIENSNGSELHIHLSPTFLNFLFIRDTSTMLKTINWVFFFLLEFAVLLLGILIYWYLLAFFPASEMISFATLIIMGLFLLINIVQIFSIYIRTIKIKY